MSKWPNVFVVGPGGLVEHVQQQYNMHIPKCCILSNLDGSGDGVLWKPVLFVFFFCKVVLVVKKTEDKESYRESK